MNYYFTSERLGFRKIAESDTAFYAGLDGDPEVMEFFPSVKTPEEVKRDIIRYQSVYTQYGFGAYSVDLLEDGRTIGKIGFGVVNFEAWFTPCVEIGWRIAKEFWNKGYGTEGALACLQYGFTKLDFKEVYCFTSLVNKRSEHLMKKLGMKHVGEFGHPRVEADHPLHQHILYKITKAGFQTLYSAK